MKKVITFFIAGMIASLALNAQVVINEFSASNLNQYQDNFKKYEDWIELYNTDSAPVDLAGWHLSDKSDNPTKWQIPAGTIIPGNGHLVFWCSGRDQIGNGHFHTSFKLTQTKNNETIVLANSAGIPVDQVAYSLTLLGHSQARNADGTGDWKVCTDPTPRESNIDTPFFDGYTTPPSMSLEAGFYNGTQMVTITSNEPNSTLRYTLDGTEPNETSPEYSQPLSITKTQVVKAKSFSNDAAVLPGKIDFNTYLIDEDFSLVVFSVAADNVIDLANGDDSFRPHGTLEYFDSSKKRVAVGYGEVDRHGQDSWALDHRSLDYFTRDEMGYEKAINAPLFSYSDRDEYQKFMFRNSGDDNYPAIDDEVYIGNTHTRDEYIHTLAQEGGMKLDVRAVERVILFLNGEYWGVYGMRERPVDHDYTDEYYNQGKFDIQYLSTWGDSEAEYGGFKAYEDWESIRDFVLENDMSNPDNYAVVEDNIQTTSLVDFFILNLNTVAADWLNYNTGWWRGLDPEGDHKKWGYIVWDLDATFDYYINYTNIPNTGSDAQPCDIEDISIAMDQFFGDFEIGDLENCPSILDGSSPYPADDSIFQQVVLFDNFCCEEWDGACQEIYDAIAAGPVDPSTCPTILSGASPYPADDSIFQQVINFEPFCCNVDWDGDCQDIYDAIATGGGPGGPIDPSLCPTILSGVSPYPDDDSIFIEVVNNDPFCCNQDWDGTCQDLYDFIAGGGNPGGPGGGGCPTVENGSSPYDPTDSIFLRVIEIDEQCCINDWDPHCQNIYDQLVATDTAIFDPRGDIGKHEKIFLKLLEENAEFKQLYYSRYADMMNTVFSCENMLTTLDSLIEIIEPEMPRQIQRWGGSMNEWQTNVSNLRDYIQRRCELLDDGLVDCYEVDGPYNLTLMVEPMGAGEIDLNTLDIETFPWSGNYFGGMENRIKAKAFDDNLHTFSHWETSAGSVIGPDLNSRKATITLTQADTLVAVFTGTVGTNDLSKEILATVYPNPAGNYLILEYDLEYAANVDVSLHSALGQKIAQFNNAGGKRPAGEHRIRLNLENQNISSGMYILNLKVDDNQRSIRVAITK